jgi:hypothetical protein
VAGFTERSRLLAVVELPVDAAVARHLLVGVETHFGKACQPGALLGEREQRPADPAAVLAGSTATFSISRCSAWGAMTMVPTI